MLYNVSAIALPADDRMVMTKRFMCYSFTITKKPEIVCKILMKQVLYKSGIWTSIYQKYA